jgi:hypothetical protein
MVTCKRIWAPKVTIGGELFADWSKTLNVTGGNVLASLSLLHGAKGSRVGASSWLEL